MVMVMRIATPTIEDTLKLEQPLILRSSPLQSSSNNKVIDVLTIFDNTQRADIGMSYSPLTRAVYVNMCMGQIAKEKAAKAAPHTHAHGLPHGHSAPSTVRGAPVPTPPPSSTTSSTTSSTSSSSSHHRAPLPPAAAAPPRPSSSSSSSSHGHSSSSAAPHAPRPPTGSSSHGSHGHHGHHHRSSSGHGAAASFKPRTAEDGLSFLSYILRSIMHCSLRM
jgi:hypothetical protein